MKLLKGLILFSILSCSTYKPKYKMVKVDWYLGDPLNQSIVSPQSKVNTSDPFFEQYQCLHIEDVKRIMRERELLSGQANR